jgi:hypothetical protein
MATAIFTTGQIFIGKIDVLAPVDAVNIAMTTSIAAQVR